MKTEEEILTIEQVLVLLDECKTGKQEAELIHRYARLQIGKDRERVKKNVRCKTEKEISTGELWPISEVDPKSIDETPIIID